MPNFTYTIVKSPCHLAGYAYVTYRKYGILLQLTLDALVDLPERVGGGAACDVLARTDRAALVGPASSTISETALDVRLFRVVLFAVGV